MTDVHAFVDELNDLEKNESDTWDRINSSIYHYTSPHGLKEILSNNSLWFTNYKFLNDKSEKYYAFNLFRECLVEEKSSINESLYEGIYNSFNFEYRYFNDISKRFYDYYIASFSSNGDSLSLWNYYAKSESKAGYSIKFDSKTLGEGLSQKIDNSLLFYEVIYDVEKQKEIIKRYINVFNRHYDYKNLHFLINYLLKCIDVVSMRLKHPSFQEERESRFVFMVQKEQRDFINNNDLLNFVESNGVIVPYLNIDISKESIKGISISPLQKDFIVKEGLLLMLDRLKYDHIKPSDVTYSDLPIRF